MADSSVLLNLYEREFSSVNSKNNYFNINNRRYIGSKQKLVPWINSLIKKYCFGGVFTEVFAGTACISQQLIKDRKYKKVILNDLLYSNIVIYEAFFKQEYFDLKKLEDFKNYFSSIDSVKIEDNYSSLNYGDKFFSKNDAKLIGFIREYLESNKYFFNDKEYKILLASLLYSLDRSANTVGHFEAYRKNITIDDTFSFDLISPLEFNSIEIEIEIYRENANELVRNIESNLIYIDPPYNSRQYSRFYHVLENITLWQKPKLYGVALKPESDNMSEYCKNGAYKEFCDLIKNIKSDFIIVSYNNSYNTKSSSSKNKITLEFISDSLSSKGKLKIFNKRHSFFSAGKTDFKNHMEFLFLTEVK